MTLRDHRPTPPRPDGNGRPSGWAVVALVASLLFLAASITLLALEFGNQT